MKLIDIINGLKDGTITILENGHSTNSLIKKMERRESSLMKRISQKKEDIRTNPTWDKAKRKTSKSLVVFYEHMLNPTKGDYVDEIQMHCRGCDEDLYVILLDDTTLGYIPSGEYWDIVAKSKKGYEYVATVDDCKTCAAIKLETQQKLVSEINVPSGKLIFQNTFTTDVLYGIDDYKGPSICSTLGRNKLMQELAANDVGYGQMGNMSVAVYSNNNDEIIIATTNADESYEDNCSWYKEHPEKIDDEWLLDQKRYKEFAHTIESGNFENKGEISLSVWRWMCADIETLKKHGEVPCTEDTYADTIEVDVKSGTYVVEHYYEFPINGDFIYSRIKLK